MTPLPAPPPRPGGPTPGPAAPAPPAPAPTAPVHAPEPADGQTGDAVAAIPAALAALEDLDGRPTADHVPAFERVHTVLTGALTAIDGV